MAAVKGSTQQRMIVVPYRPWLKALVVLGGLLVLLAAGYSSYWYGQQQREALYANAVSERDRLRVELAVRTEENDRLRQEVANLSLGAEVDRQASEEVRNEVISLKSEIATLQKDISFYRGLMSPGGGEQGLTIGSLDVLATGVPRQYHYKLVVQQLAVRHAQLTGSLQFNIIGRQGERLVTLALKDVSDNVASEHIPLRFKYFQTLEGRINLPANFEPEKIELVAKSTGQNAAVVKKKFGWLIQES